MPGSPTQSMRDRKRSLHGIWLWKSSEFRDSVCLKEESIRDLWDTTKHSNIHITGIAEGEESEQGIENLFEKIMTENFPNLVKEKDTQIQEA